MSRLPRFVKPMLATSGSPFSDPAFIFEIKWDGYRAITLRDGDGYRIWSRNETPLQDRYPELRFLTQLPEGVILDGEVVALTEGRSSFDLLISTKSLAEQSGTLAYVVFDLLYEDYESIMGRPLFDRRKALRSIVDSIGNQRLIFSDHLEGSGEALFAQASEAGLEGIVAKRADSVYQPGRRSGSWIKIKRSQEAYCVVIGYLPKEGNDFKSLVVASNLEGGELAYVGNVGTGFTQSDRESILSRLAAIPREHSVIPCDQPARWVEPELFITVRYSDTTAAGMLRAPIFVGVAST